MQNLVRVACVLLLGCAPGPVGEAPLVLESVSVREGAQLFLNEPLRLVFSAPLDPLSVTETSAAIYHPNGERVAGTWELSGRTLQFTPRPILARDLSDGGYRLGESMLCEVRGFPYVGGVRSLDGEPLVRTYRRQLEVVGDGQELFQDDTYLYGDFVQFAARPSTEPSVMADGGSLTLYEGEPLYLVCEEPLDPRSLDSDEFWIEQREPEPAADEQSRWDLTVRLVRNDPPGRRGQFEPCAVIELTPRSPLPGSSPKGNVKYVLRNADTVSLTDLGGNSVWQIRDPQSPGLALRVVPSDLDGPDSLRLDFLDGRGLTSVRVPWADGTARAEGGRVVARFPAIAGSGAAGQVDLEGEIEPSDVQSHRLTIPSGVTASWGPGPGMRLLRAQGLLRVAGKLERQDPDRAADPLLWDPDEPRGGPASRFLAEAREESRTWTVLVAGGDLWIEGDVVVDTPLILVAGGRIRIDGRVRSADNQLFLLGDGGSLNYHRALDLALDPPAHNALAAPISMALLTSPLPRRVRERYLWRGLEAGLAAGSGAARVRFLAADAPLERASLVDHPGLLPPDQPLRVLIELDLLDGETWDPPAVDFVSFSWDDR